MWFDVPHSYMRPTPGSPSAVEAADELEAFAHGKLHRLLGPSTGAPSTVLQLNQVAHATLAELEQLAEAPVRRARRTRDRSALARLLARHVLEHADGPADVARIQRVALWPLEEALLSSSSDLRTDGHLVAFLATAAIDDAGRGRTPVEH